MELDYTIIYSQRKKLAITVERDRSVVVHAPAGTDPVKISQVVESRKQWIYEKTRHSQKYSGPPHPPGKELVNGESLLYLGRHYRIEMVDSDAASIQFSNKFFVPKKLYAIRHRAFKRWYFSRAEEKIPPRIHLHAQNLGIAYNQAKIIDVKYRWGSCTLKDNLNFNWRLIKAPMFVIDYVIVHELAHLFESNHTPRFWNIVRAQSAKMDEAKQWLKEHGEILETEI
jgi:predicted metal-dependent hydrolase